MLSKRLDTKRLETKGLETKGLERRQALKALGGVGLGMAFGCGSKSATSPSSASGTTTTTTTTTGTSGTASCAVTPSETAGPYPSLSDFIRSDIREGKSGTNLSLTIKVVNSNSNCAALSGAQVEIWHCDVTGNYSQYGTQTAQTYLRGVQTTNANGEVNFTTIYPGWYQGRATHIHMEVTVNGRSVKVTQIAFPEAINNTVYAAGVYASRGSNPTNNLSDGIFSDSLSSELVTPSGSPAAGYIAAYQINVSV